MKQARVRLQKCLVHCAWTCRVVGQARHSEFANGECLKPYSNKKSPAVYTWGRTQAGVPARLPPAPQPNSPKRMLLSFPAPWRPNPQATRRTLTAQHLAQLIKNKF